jgi:hypothetical protein
MFLSKEDGPRLNKLINNHLLINEKETPPCVLKRPLYGIYSNKKELWWEFLKKYFEELKTNHEKISSEIIFEYGLKTKAIKVSNNVQEGLFAYNPQ